MPTKKKAANKKTQPIEKNGSDAKAKSVRKKNSTNRKTVPRTSHDKAPTNPLQLTDRGFPIVGIGASAGGLEAFEALFEAMPGDTGMGFVLVAHLDPSHASLLPELLQKHTRMPVQQIQDGTQVKPNHIYVIPPNKELQILQGVLQLMELPQPRSNYLPIDIFFRSLARDQGVNAVGIILSGTGTDGSLGLKEIKAELGMVMVQDEQSAKYDGMPRAAIGTRIADFIMSPSEMPAQLVQYFNYAAKKAEPGLKPLAEDSGNALQKIFILLRARTDHDFSQYRKNTICRRIERRMNLHQIDNITNYVDYLRESEREVSILFRELLIGVTNFFRDAPAFKALADEALTELLGDKPEGYTIRVWVPGCSSGEEAYSIAILLQECMEKLQLHYNVQIFGTDIDEEAIDIARAAIYPASIQADIDPQRLKRFFVKEEDGRYRIRKSIREMLVFAPQSIIKDPPFTKLDLLSCRNLLIYLGTELQRKLLPLFHYSLRPNGVLFLGSSESIGQATELFTAVNKKWKIFRRTTRLNETETVPDMPALPKQRESIEVDPGDLVVRHAEELSAQQLIETILQESDTPPCVIIDDNCNVVYIHGRTGRYLEPAEGKRSSYLLEMARPGLKVKLADAIRRVIANKQTVTQKGLRIQSNGDHFYIDLSVRPILQHSTMHDLMMVSFQEVAHTGKGKAAKTEPVKSKQDGRTVAELEQELKHSRENLQTTIEELETSNEELKSTNEELQSTNEELQSTNEEMETSKEELQSLNEESTTVNAELQSRIDELSNTNDDMKNLLDSTEIATLFLDDDLCVRRFTPRTTAIVPLSAADIGRPIKHFSTNLIDLDLTDYATQVLDDLAVRTREVQSKDGQIFFMRMRPYRTVTNVIDGVVITFDDITEQKKAKQELEDIRTRLQQQMLDQSRELFQVLAHNAPLGIYQTDAEGNYLYVNQAWSRLTGVKPNEALGEGWLKALHPDDRDAVQTAWQRAIDANEPFEMEFRLQTTDGINMRLLSQAAPLRRDKDSLDGFVGTIINITDKG